MFLDFLLDVREYNSTDVTKEIAASFPTKVILKHQPLQDSEAQAFADVFKHVRRRIDEIDLRYCNLTTHQFSIFVDGILSSRSRVCRSFVNIC